MFSAPELGHSPVLTAGGDGALAIRSQPSLGSGGVPPRCFQVAGGWISFSCTASRRDSSCVESQHSVATGQISAPFALRSRISLDPREHLGASLQSGCLPANGEYVKGSALQTVKHHNLVRLIVLGVVQPTHVGVAHSFTALDLN